MHASSKLWVLLSIAVYITVYNSGNFIIISIIFK